MLNLDRENLVSLFKDFYTLTSIHICLFDENKTEIFRYPENYSGFCAHVRQNEQIARKCKDCDNLAFERCTEMNGRYTYICHMNLSETVTPLYYDGEIIGYVMMGQVKLEQSDFRNISEESKLLIPDACRAEKLYDGLPTLPDKVISASAHILDACASYLCGSKLVVIQSEELQKRIDGFIAENLEKDLTVDDLCRNFHTSRTEIYELFKSFYHSTVAQYLRHRKLNYAKSLLSDTTLPITKIAIKTGFNDYNYFSKVFKKHYGITASNYRKEHRHLIKD